MDCTQLFLVEAVVSPEIMGGPYQVLLCILRDGGRAPVLITYSMQVTLWIVFHWILTTL